MTTVSHRYGGPDRQHRAVKIVIARQMMFIADLHC